MRRWISLALALICARGIVAQASSAGEGPYRIVGVTYDLEGRTTRAALEKLLAIDTWRVFKDASELEAYVAELRRVLANERVLDLSSSIEYGPATGLDAMGPPSPAPVELRVAAKETLSAILLPFPKYSEAEGLSLSLRYKDNNFLGSLKPFSLNADYFAAGRELRLGTDVSALGELFGRSWSFSLAGDSAYAEGGILEPNFSVSLSTRYELRPWGRAWEIEPAIGYSYSRAGHEHSADASFVLGPLSTSLSTWAVGSSWRYAYAYGAVDTASLRSGLSLGSSQPIASLAHLGKLSYLPSTELYGLVPLAGNAEADLGWTLSQGFSLGRVDWVGNFRRGASFSISDALTWHLVEYNPGQAVDDVLALDASAFFRFNEILGLNARFTGRWFSARSFYDPSAAQATDWETYLRGTRGPLFGDIVAIANLELPINFAQGQFFGSARLASEVFLAPFLDAGYVRGASEREFLSSVDLFLDMGLEIQVWPLVARAFTYRLSAGYDLADYYETRAFDAAKLEVFLGLGSLF